MCYMYYVDHIDLSRVLHVLCGPQGTESCITCTMWTTETWVVCYMYYVRPCVTVCDLGRVLHVLCGPRVTCIDRDLGSCVTCIMWTTETWVVCYMYYVNHMYYVDHRDLGRVLHVLCGPQRPGVAVTCICPGVYVTCIMWTTETWVVCYMYYGTTCIMWTTETWVVCYMYYVDHRDLGRGLHVLCGPQRPGSCITCIM